MTKSKRISAIVFALLMLMQVVMPMSVFAQDSMGEDVTEITVGNTETLNFTVGEYEFKTFEFAPALSGAYRLKVTGDNMLSVSVSECDADGEYHWLGGDSLTNDSFYFTAQQGCTYSIRVEGVASFPAEAYVALEDAPAVTKVSISNLPYDTTYFKEDISNISLTGLEVLIDLADGSSYVWNVWRENYVAGHKIEYSISETGKFVFSCQNKTVEYQFKIIENPVSKIEYAGKPIEYIKNTNGYKYGDNYHYYYSDLMFKVTFKNGTVKNVAAWEDVIEGMYLRCQDNQDENPWTVGVNNYIEVYFGGVKTKVPVKIVDTKVSKITVTKNPTASPVFGDLSTGYFDGGTYSCYLSDLNGLKFTVTYKDGTKKEFYGEDADIRNDNIGDYWFETDTYITAAAPGEIKIPFNFEGAEAEYKVTLKKSNVKSVSLVKGPDQTEVAEGFIPGYIGTEFKVTYTDGKTETLKITKDNLEFNYYNDPYVEKDGKTFAIFCNKYYPYGLIEEPFMYYMGVKCPVPQVTVGAALDVASISVKNADDSNKMVITATYADGTKEDFKMDKYGAFSGRGGLDVICEDFYINTKYGFMNVSMETDLYAGLPRNVYIRAFGCLYTEELNKGVTLSGIEIAKKPNIIRYEKGEAFDPSGLVVRTKFSNGVTGEIYYDYGDYDIKVSDVDTSKAGTKTVTVTFEGKKATFTVEVGGSFKDVESGSWYEKYVNYAAKYGMFKGTGNGNFSPDTNLTRAQFVQVLANIEGVKLDNTIKTSFKDVPSGQWYTGAVQWAADNNVVKGMGDGTFEPDTYVTREQMCVILVNYIEKNRLSQLDKKVIGKTFADDADISSWAKAAVYKAQRAGLVSGVGDNKFAPGLTATRKEGATIFTKFHGDYVY